jgi:hypothetical protein
MRLRFMPIFQRLGEVRAQMNRQSALADDFWLAARNQVGMAPMVNSRLLGLGLGTALLAEMVEASPAWMSIRDGRAFVNRDAPWLEADDCLWEIAYLVWEEQEALTRRGRRAPGAGVPALLRYLGGHDKDDARPRAQVMLEGKLTRSGTYERRVIGDAATMDHRVVEQGRLALGEPPLAKPVVARQGLLRTKWVHLPLSPNVTGMPTVLINRKIQRGEPLSYRDLTLIALFDLADITRRAETVGAEYWPTGEQCRMSLPPELSELLRLADEVKGTHVMR